jgi:sulfide:quinone oxidoreductase
MRMPPVCGARSFPAMADRSPVHPRRVVIAGGGIAAVEALMALADLGDGRLELELLAPGGEFVLRPQLLGRPWGSPPIHIPLERCVTSTERCCTAAR